MIIADSNMSMSSRRHYSQKVSSGMVAAGSSGNSFSFGMSQARSSLSKKESYFSNSSDSPGRKYDDMFLMMPLYNRSGRLMSQTILLKRIWLVRNHQKARRL